MVELVDTTDLKSVGPHAVPVRVRVAAPLWITARSSAGQSNGLLSRGSGVRILPGRPKFGKKEVDIAHRLCYIIIEDRDAETGGHGALTFLSPKKKMTFWQNKG